VFALVMGLALGTPGLAGAADVAAASTPSATAAPVADVQGPDATANAPASSNRAAITFDESRAAASAVRADPVWGSVRKERRLRLKDDGKPEQPPPKSSPENLRWLESLVRWFAESARVLVWVMGAIAVAVVLVLLRRWIGVRADSLGGRAISLPSHVRDLDIRPESLPEDIAAAARALWLRGEQRTALSLLYRGALSRLVHGHAVPIRAASTEGECVRLAARVLNADSGGFFERLVRAWLLAVYGARSPESQEVMALCDAFDQRLPRQAAPAEAPA
jgi:hypothetical protein